MAWECSDCGAREQGNSRMPICHHCGKLVCRKHREMIIDSAFSPALGDSQSRVAVHCLVCRLTFHPNAANLEQGTPSAQGLSA